MTDEQPPNVRILLSSRPENVAVVREVLAGLADAIEIDTIEDVKVAVSEACNNVVVHAYDERGGPLEVEVFIGRRELDVVVRDFGVGIGPRVVDDDFPGHGIGLAVIEALASRAEMRAHAGQGLEMAMRFDLPEQPEFRGADPEPTVAAAEGSAERLEVIVAPAALAPGIFVRLLGALGARAGFSIDRLADAQLVADALAAHLPAALAEPHIRLGVAASERRIDLWVEPLLPGGSAGVVADSAIGELGPIIERLVDEVEIHPNGTSEALALSMWERRSARSTSAA
jgi:anti-sigma regulatory factor (Ser/Thr protein kinase)